MALRPARYEERNHAGTDGFVLWPVNVSVACCCRKAEQAVVLARVQDGTSSALVAALNPKP